jgi:hypothetical protein
VIRDILNKDLQDTRITDIVGKNIYYLHMSGDSKPNVYIEFEIIRDTEEDFCGDDNLTLEATIQVDIFSNVAGLKDYFKLDQIVQDVLKEKEYGYLYGIELYEQETALYHRGIRFNKKVFK